MRLSLRVQKRLYAAATGGCLTATIAVAVHAVRSVGVKKHEPAIPVVATNAKTPATLNGTSGLPAKQEFGRLWDRPLRQALYDPPPPKAVVKQLPPIRIELLGTILEEANSMALVRSESGSTEYKRLGDSLGPAESPAIVVEIGADAITVERAEERVTLKVQNKSFR